MRYMKGNYMQEYLLYGSLVACKAFPEVRLQQIDKDRLLFIIR